MSTKELRLSKSGSNSSTQAGYALAANTWLRKHPTQSNLGAALATLGERESGTEHLEQAVTAYAEALKERTRARVPLDWAATQNNLGAAVTILGRRESGTERLEQAVAAYAEALKERTRARVPLDSPCANNL